MLVENLNWDCDHSVSHECAKKEIHDSSQQLGPLKFGAVFFDVCCHWM